MARKFNDLEVLGGLVLGLRELQKRGLGSSELQAIALELEERCSELARRERSRLGGLESARRRNRRRPRGTHAPGA